MESKSCPTLLLDLRGQILKFNNQTRRIPCLNFVLCYFSLATEQRSLNELKISHEPEVHFNSRLRIRGQINPLLTTGNEEIHTSAYLSAFMTHQQCLYETHIHY